ncbi:MAG: hypothetical protein MK101_06670 [Phycisphaerales bacterium]|nr:hypothetical protein [Phycisphaerales bacterium]
MRSSQSSPVSKAAEPDASKRPGRAFLAALGPGLIFAGASVGVSHLVQSTRAGTGWGLSMWLVILAALVFKYPPFRFAPLWTAATGHSLLEGYRRLGRWSLVLFALLTLATMFAVQAAVTVVTAALLHDRLINWGIGSPGIAWLNAVLLLGCGGLLVTGGYRWLDRLTKVLVPLFTVLTIVAAAMMVPHLGGESLSFWPTGSAWQTAGTIAFVAMLIGWMPTAVDLAAWQSLWVLERGRLVGQRPSVRGALLDFDIGYICTGLLAFCFLILGAGMMQQGVAFPSKGTEFPAFFIGLYGTTVGPWAGGIVGVSALAVMISTTIAVLDGFPRVIAVLLRRFRTEETASGFEVSPAGSDADGGRRAYLYSMIVMAVGAFALLQFLGNALLPMVDLATIASFLTAPVLAWLNHRVVTGPDMPQPHRLRRGMLVWSWASILLMGAFALFYLVWRVDMWLAPPA